MQRLGHFLGFAVLASIVGPHDALELGELQHHLGDQVALGELGGARGMVGIAADPGGDEGAYGLDALRLVGQRAQRLLEYHALEGAAP